MSQSRGDGAESGLPNLFLIGAPKCGTGSLANLFTQHGEIFVPRVKETFFFDDDSSYAEGPERLRSYFPPGLRQRYLCDATPTYLARGETVIPRLEAFYSDTSALKLIAILRHPVERFVSHVGHQILRRVEERSVDEVAQAELEAWARGDAAGAECLAPGFYARHLAGWFESFEAGQLRVVFSEDLASKPELVMAELVQFLELEARDAWQPRRLNAAGMPRSASVAQFLSRASRGKDLLRRLAPVTWRSFLRRRLIAWNTRPLQGAPRLADELRARIAELYRPDAELLHTRIGKQPPWQL